MRRGRVRRPHEDEVRRGRVRLPVGVLRELGEEPVALGADPRDERRHVPGRLERGEQDRAGVRRDAERRQERARDRGHLRRGEQVARRGCRPGTTTWRRCAGPRRSGSRARAAARRCRRRRGTPRPRRGARRARAPARRVARGRRRRRAARSDRAGSGRRARRARRRAPRGGPPSGARSPGRAARRGTASPDATAAAPVVGERRRGVDDGRGRLGEREHEQVRPRGEDHALLGPLLVARDGGAHVLGVELRVAVPGQARDPLEGARLERRREVVRALVLVELHPRVVLRVRVVGDRGEVAA